ncbi:MAG: polysaccharide deacetylase family protein [Terricaulis sp.]
MERAQTHQQGESRFDALVARARKGVSQRVTRNVSLWRRRSQLKSPLATFSFDDFPKSAWTNGGPLLARYGARATYFVAGGLEGQTLDGLRHFDRDDLTEIAAAGHEIGCHTFDHMRIVFGAKSEVEATLKRNADFVREAAGVEMTTFAYPFGHVNLSTKYMIANRFAAARGIWVGANAPNVDMAQVQAIPIESRSWDATDFDALIAQAQRSNGWLVFFGHDVQEKPSPFGCTPAQLESLLQRVTEAGVEIQPFKDAAARVAAA